MVNNTGTAIIFSTCLILGVLYGFKWQLIVLMLIMVFAWLVPIEKDLLVKNNKLINEKLRLEIKLLKSKIYKK